MVFLPERSRHVVRPPYQNNTNEAQTCEGAEDGGQGEVIAQEKLLHLDALP